MTNKSLTQLNKQLKDDIDKKTAIDKSQWRLIESLLKKEMNNNVQVQKKAGNKADWRIYNWTDEESKPEP